MKKAKIDLQYIGGVVCQYKVIRLVNLATFSTRTGRSIHMIGSMLAPREVQELSLDRKYEVTITEAK